MFTERSEPIILITCWYLCFPVSQALWFAIRCCCLVGCHSASSPLTYSMIPSLTLCLCSLHNQPSLESAIPRAPVIHRCSTNFICSFIKHDGSAHIYIYIYTHTYKCQLRIRLPSSRLVALLHSAMNLTTNGNEVSFIVVTHAQYLLSQKCACWLPV